MKTLKSILQKTVLPVALSSAIFFGGCGGEKDSKGIGKFLSQKNKEETEYIESKKTIRFEPADFEREEGSQIYNPLFYDIESGKKISLRELFSSSEGDGTFTGLFNNLRDNLVHRGYDFSIFPHDYGLTNLLFPPHNTKNFLFFEKDYIRFDEKGRFLAKPILNKLSNITYQDIKRAEESIRKGEDHLTFIKTEENNHYILREKFRRGTPPEMEIDVYKLKNSKVPYFSSYLPVN